MENGDCFVRFFVFAICFRQMTFFCDRNNFSSDLAIMVSGSANAGRYTSQLIWFQCLVMLLSSTRIIIFLQRNLSNKATEIVNSVKFFQNCTDASSI